MRDGLSGSTYQPGARSSTTELPGSTRGGVGRGARARRSEAGAQVEEEQADGQGGERPEDDLEGGADEEGGDGGVVVAEPATDREGRDEGDRGDEE
jgi:hypothetical protein